MKFSERELEKAIEKIKILSDLFIHKQNEVFCEFMIKRESLIKLLKHEKDLGINKSMVVFKLINEFPNIDDNMNTIKELFKSTIDEGVWLVTQISEDFINDNIKLDKLYKQLILTIDEASNILVEHDKKKEFIINNFKVET